MRKYVLILLILALIPGLTYAGWEKLYGGEGEDQGYCVRSTADSGYIVSGMTTRDLGGSSEDVWLIKLDPKGEIEWSRTYDYLHHDVGWCVRQTSDGGFIICCTSGYTEPWILRVSSSGDSITSRLFDPGVEARFRFINSTTGGDYIITGYKGEMPRSVWLVKIDTLFNTIWEKEYGFSSSGYSVEVTSDGGYLVAGVTEDSGGLDTKSDLWILKTDSLGDTIWTRRYHGSNQAIGYSVIEASDGNYVVSGRNGYYNQQFVWENTDLIIIKLDTEGNFLWTRSYNNNAFGRGRCVKETIDGGYVICGSTEVDLWLVRTDAQGDTVWTRVFGEEYNGCYGYHLDVTDGGGFIVTGWAEWPVGNQQLYLLKTDSLGLLGVEEPSAPTLQHDWQITQSIGRTITLRAPEGAEPLDLAVFDASGRMIDELILDGSATITWGECYGPGVYFIKEISKDPITRKVILLK